MLSHLDTTDNNSEDAGNARNDQAHGLHNESLMTPKALQIAISPPRCPPYYTAQRSFVLGAGRPTPDRDLYVVVDEDYAGVASGLISTAAGVKKLQTEGEAHSVYDRRYHHQDQQQLRRHEFLVDRFLYHLSGRKHRHDRRRQREDIAYNTSSSLCQHPHWKTPGGILSSFFLRKPSTGPLQLTDSLTRFLGTVLSLETQNRFRDGGGFRNVCDGLVTATIPLAAVTNPSALLSFTQLTFFSKNERLVYGTDDEKSQFIDVFFPSTTTQSSNQQQQQPRGMVMFLHGGAWGSGKPWFYRLVALTFLKIGFAVAIIGYRVYPTGDVNVQVQDVGMAYNKLCLEYPELMSIGRRLRRLRKEDVGDNDGEMAGTEVGLKGSVLVGHSSGAHVALLWVVERIKKIMHDSEKSAEQGGMVDVFIGISGPYNISHHFDYEAARGVEEISPLKAANGLTRDQLRKNSPANKLLRLLVDVDESDSQNSIGRHFPTSLFIHGIEDETVPFTATSEICRVLRSVGLGDKCSERYIPSTGHQDAVVQLMLGGRVQTAVQEWLTGKQKTKDTGRNLFRSKL